MQNQPVGAATQDVSGSSARYRLPLLSLILVSAISMATTTPPGTDIAHRTDTADKVSISQTAQPTLPATELKRLRNIYREADRALEKKDIKRFNALQQQLTDYPLYPYLEYRRIRRDLSGLTEKQFNQFSKKYSETPLPARLRSGWLSHLAGKKRWKLFLKHFPAGSRSVTQRCLRLQALHKTGNSRQAYQETADLWTVGQSQPSACNKPFNRWIRAGHLDEQRAFSRFLLALNKGEVGLARYVTRYIDDKKLKGITKNALNLQKKPANLATVRLSDQQPGYSSLITATLKRLARTDIELALKLWFRFKPTLKLDEQQLAGIEQRLGLRLLQNYDTRSPHWLKQLDPGFKNARLLEWRLRYELSRQNWPRVEQLLNKLPATEQSKDRWHYWRARTLEHNGGKSRAVEIFSELSEKRSFYGFLSADRLGLDYSLNNRSAPADLVQLEKITSLPGMLRARELHYHRQLTSARREWHRTTRNFSNEQHYQAAILARRWGWYSQAIMSAINARMWDDLRIRFPAAYSRSISSSSERFSIDPPWVFAVARQESAFNASVRSPAGATGLMQLMPATAKQTARSIQLRYRNREQLKDPSTNIQLGSAYLSQLLNKHKGNRVWATAAYNAGPHRVKRWLKERGSLPVDLWIETIPYRETRQYVQNVLAYTVIYSDLLGQPKQFLKKQEATALPLIN